jgi:stage V sporulation protein AE
MEYVMAFLIGGAICVIAQLLIDVGKLSQMHVMSLLVVIGVVLTSFGLYDRFVALAGVGATMPISGFGYSLMKGVLAHGKENGWWSIGAGMFQFAGISLSFVIVLSFLTALVCKPKG